VHAGVFGRADIISSMLGWSLNLFRVRGILLSIHFSFFILLAVNAFDGWADSGWLGAAWSTAALLAFFVCVILHEFGHAFTALAYGIGVRRILLMPIGGMAEFDHIPRQPRRELLITLAGPSVNFIIAGLLALALPADLGPSPTNDESAVLSWLAFGDLLMHWNIAMGCFNLLPAFPMDGGRILRALLATRMNYLRATFWAATTGKLISATAAITAFAYLQQPLLGALFVFIFIVGELEYRATKRRETDEAHLLATFIRLSEYRAIEDAGRVPPARRTSAPALAHRQEVPMPPNVS
jgi:Zn-dependent protease